ncbi:hypothetical protein GCM10027402_29980 [Arthrobacter monumenti]
MTSVGYRTAKENRRSDDAHVPIKSPYPPGVVIDGLTGRKRMQPVQARRLNVVCGRKIDRDHQPVFQRVGAPD